jgi:hypothetical protein
MRRIAAVASLAWAIVASVSNGRVRAAIPES